MKTFIRLPDEVIERARQLQSEVKLCRKCGRTLPISEFYWDKINNCFQYQCKDCKKKYAAEYQKSPRGHDVHLRATRKYHQTVDNEARREFYKTADGKAYLRERNKAESFLESCKKYRQSEKGKTRKALNERKRRARFQEVLCTLTLEEWQEILQSYQFSCYYCGRDDVKMTIEHVIPISRGGNHTKENVVPACGSCNSSKRERLIDEWQQYNQITR